MDGETLCLDGTTIRASNGRKQSTSVELSRKKLEYAMSDAAKADRQSVVEAMENGATQEAAVAAFVSEERFDAWYAQLMDELNELAAK